MMYGCILNDLGEICLHKNIPTQPRRFLRLIEPYQEDIVVGVECIFSWYWLADLCAEHGIEFILGHALYMKAIHGGKSKNDKIDSEKIAKLIRGGTFLWPIPIRRRCVLLAICCADATTWCTCAPRFRVISS